VGAKDLKGVRKNPMSTSFNLVFRKKKKGFNVPRKDYKGPCSGG
jgi:hypothetical protein